MYQYMLFNSSILNPLQYYLNKLKWWYSSLHPHQDASYNLLIYSLMKGPPFFKILEICCGQLNNNFIITCSASLSLNPNMSLHLMNAFLTQGLSIRNTLQKSFHYCWEFVIKTIMGKHILLKKIITNSKP